MKGFFTSSQVQKEKPTGLIPRCGACQLYKRCESPKMVPYGDGRKGVLVVGEAPDQTEDEMGRPFVGKAGEFLRDTLDEIGVDLDRDAWVTNALICCPSENKTPDADQISYCRPNLLNTIRLYEPHVVVTLGRAALVSVIDAYWKSDVGPLERWTGWTIPIENHWICPTWHPSFLIRMRNQLMDRQFKSHLEEAFSIKQLPPKQEDWKEQIELIYDDREVFRALREMDQEGGYVAVDYEGNCIKPEWEEARAYSFAVSNGRRTISYPWQGMAIEATGLFLRSPRTKKIASNLKMEERWTLKLFGHGVNQWGWDTMLATHCLDNRPGICSLKFQSLVKLGVPSYNESVEPYLMSSEGHYNRIAEIELKTLLLYGGMDALLEWRLARQQRKEMGL